MLYFSCPLFLVIWRKQPVSGFTLFDSFRSYITFPQIHSYVMGFVSCKRRRVMNLNADCDICRKCLNILDCILDTVHAQNLLQGCFPPNLDRNQNWNILSTWTSYLHIFHSCVLNLFNWMWLLLCHTKVFNFQSITFASFTPGIHTTPHFRVDEGKWRLLITMKQTLTFVSWFDLILMLILSFLNLSHYYPMTLSQKKNSAFYKWYKCLYAQ